MAFTDTWDATFEAKPDDNNYGYEIDNFIRRVQTAVRERMEIDHQWKVGADDGEHVKITFSKQSSKPSNVANKGFLYIKDASGKVELFWEDEDGNEIQLTSAGYINQFPSGTKMVFYQDTAPSGWTIEDTLDDKLLFVTKGSSAGGETGGGAHATGTWTQPDHVHAGGSHTHVAPSHHHTDPAAGAHQLTIAEMPTHHHTYSMSVNGLVARSDSNAGVHYTFTTANTGDTGGDGTHVHPSGGDTGDAGDEATSGATGNTDGGATANTWRPAAYCVIICTKA